VDRITVTGIEVFAHHGVLPHERELGQRFVVDLALDLDLARRPRPTTSPTPSTTATLAATSPRSWRATRST
jgi:hypothetical protein